MEKYLVVSKPLDVKKSAPFAIKRRIYEVENAAAAISKANTENGIKWHVIAVYEQIWHI